MKALLRITSHKHAQRPFGKTALSYPARWYPPWPGWLFRGRPIRRHRVEHPSRTQGPLLQGHAQLVPALFPVQGAHSVIVQWTQLTLGSSRSRSTCPARLSCTSQYGGLQTSVRYGTSGTQKRFCPCPLLRLDQASRSPAAATHARARLPHQCLGPASRQVQWSTRSTLHPCLSRQEEVRKVQGERGW